MSNNNIIWSSIFCLCNSSHRHRLKRHMDTNMDGNSRCDSIDISRHTPTASSPSPSCEMCRNYELQLQIIQLNEEDLKKQVNTYDSMIINLKEELKREKVNRSELEEKFTEEAKATELKLQECSIKLEESSKSVTELQNQFEQLGADTSNQIADFSHHKERLVEELKRLQEENNVLLARHIAKARQIQSEAIDLPSNMDDCHFYLLNLREDYISSIVAKENLEEYVNQDRHMLMNQNLEKDRVIQKLQADLGEYASQLHKVSTENEKRKLDSKEQEETLEQCQERIAQLMLEKEELVSEIKWKLQEVTREKLECENELLNLRAKLSSLQIELDNSEQVQRDFVKLSQSLQIELEKIRQSDNEVRWQHEDDVVTCNACSRKFNSKKDKIHCSHCGKLFCPDCVSKIIHSGPRSRPFKVCNVCHTLLDHDSAPYFSSEPLSSPH